MTALFLGLILGALVGVAYGEYRLRRSVDQIIRPDGSGALYCEVTPNWSAPDGPPPIDDKSGDPGVEVLA